MPSSSKDSNSSNVVDLREGARSKRKKLAQATSPAIEVAADSVLKRVAPHSDCPHSDCPHSDCPRSDRSRPSAIASGLERLKSATMKVITHREKLPQPLFWSLFHTEIENLKEKRREKRKKLAELYDCDWA